jgi:hypothetical protein
MLQWAMIAIGVTGACGMKNYKRACLLLLWHSVCQPLTDLAVVSGMVPLTNADAFVSQASLASTSRRVPAGPHSFSSTSRYGDTAAGE